MTTLTLKMQSRKNKVAKMKRIKLKVMAEMTFKKRLNAKKKKFKIN